MQDDKHLNIILSLGWRLLVREPYPEKKLWGREMLKRPAADSALVENYVSRAELNDLRLIWCVFLIHPIVTALVL